jgi:hypothetical protein
MPTITRMTNKNKSKHTNTKNATLHVSHVTVAIKYCYMFADQKLILNIIDSTEMNNREVIGLHVSSLQASNPQLKTTNAQTSCV